MGGITIVIKAIGMRYFVLKLRCNMDSISLNRLCMSCGNLVVIGVYYIFVII